MLELERPHLMSLPVLFDGYVERPARVSSTSLVAVARNRYSVEIEKARAKMDVSQADPKDKPKI